MIVGHGKTDVHQSWVDQVVTDDFPKVMNVTEGSRYILMVDDMGAFAMFHGSP